MNKEKKFQGLLNIGITDIAGTGITAFFWFFLATLIEPGEYGQIFYYIAIVGMASQFVLIGSINTITVYTSKKIKIESTLYFISLALSAVASLIMILIFYKVDIIFLFFGYVIHGLTVGEILGKKSFFQYTKYSITQKILTLVLGLSFYFLFGIDGIIFALGISYVGFLFILIKQFRNSKIDFGLLKNRTQFIFQNYIIRIVEKAKEYLNQIVMAPFLGFVMLGNFSLLIQFVSVAMILSHIVFKYTLPSDSRGQKNKKLKLYTLLISVFAAITGFIVLPYIIPTLFPKFIEIIEPARIIILSVIPLTVINILTSEHLGNERNRRLLISKVISLSLFLAMILLLGAEFGLMGVTFGFLISVIVEAICLIPINRKND